MFQQHMQTGLYFKAQTLSAQSMFCSLSSNIWHCSFSSSAAYRFFLYWFSLTTAPSFFYTAAFPRGSCGIILTSSERKKTGNCFLLVKENLKLWRNQYRTETVSMAIDLIFCLKLAPVLTQAIDSPLIGKLFFRSEDIQQ